VAILIYVHRFLDPGTSLSEFHVHSNGMKTHIELDDELLEQVFRLGGFATKKAAVNTALAEYAKLLKRRELLEMRGKIPWEGDLNEMRADRRGRR